MKHFWILNCSILCRNTKNPSTSRVWHQPAMVTHWRETRVVTCTCGGGALIVSSNQWPTFTRAVYCRCVSWRTVLYWLAAATDALCSGRLHSRRPGKSARWELLLLPWQPGNFVLNLSSITCKKTNVVLLENCVVVLFVCIVSRAVRFDSNVESRPREHGTCRYNTQLYPARLCRVPVCCYHASRYS